MSDDVYPWTPDAVCETHEWIPPTGRGLETIRFVTRVGARARMMPPVTIQTLRVPLGQGGHLLSTRHEERLVTLPVVVPGPQTGRDVLRAWAKSLDPLHGLSTLRCVQGPNEGRQLSCVYESGLEEYTEEFPGLGLTPLTFRAPDPYWQDSEVTTVQVQNSIWAPPNSYLDSLGDVDAWPTMRLSVPAAEAVKMTTSGIRIRRRLGAAWQTDFQIPGPFPDAPISLLITTQPGAKSVTSFGVNWFSRLTPNSTLWSIPPYIEGGSHQGVEFTALGVDPGTLTLTLEWRDRWLAA